MSNSKQTFTNTPFSRLHQTSHEASRIIQNSGLDALTIKWWPTERKGDASAIVAASLRGTRTQVKGLIGYAPFLVINEDMTPKGRVMLIVSTVPLLLTDHPEASNSRIEVEYVQAESGIEGVHLFVSTNYTGNGEQMRLAMQSVKAAHLRTFEGDNVFVTFSTRFFEWSIEGPSSGLAMYVAFNQYVTGYHWSGELTVSEFGALSLLPIAGVQAKVELVRAAEQILVTPASKQAADFALESQIPYTDPASAAAGVFVSRTSLILIADLGSVRTVVQASMLKSLKVLTAEESASANAFKQGAAAGKQPKRTLDDLVSAKMPKEKLEETVSKLSELALQSLGSTGPKIREKIKAWIAADWPGSSSDEYNKYLVVSDFWNEEHDGFSPEDLKRVVDIVSQPAPGLSVSRDRVLAAVRMMNVDMFKRWDKQMKSLGLAGVPVPGSKRSAEKARKAARKPEDLVPKVSTKVKGPAQKEKAPPKKIAFKNRKGFKAFRKGVFDDDAMTQLSEMAIAVYAHFGDDAAESEFMEETAALASEDVPIEEHVADELNDLASKVLIPGTRGPSIKP